MTNTPQPSNAFSEWLDEMFTTFNGSGAHACYCQRSEDGGCKCAIKDEYTAEAKASILKRHEEELLAAHEAGKREGSAVEAVYQLTWCKSRNPTTEEYDSLIQHYTEILTEIEQLKSKSNNKEVI